MNNYKVQCNVPVEKVMRLAADLLSIAAYTFSNHGCNDFDKPEYFTEAEWKQFGIDYEVWNSGGDDDPCDMGDWVAMNWCSALLEELLPGVWLKLSADAAVHAFRCDELTSELATSKRETFETTVELKAARDSIASLERQLASARERIDVLLDHGLADVDLPKCLRCGVHPRQRPYITVDPGANGLCRVCDQPGCYR